MTRIPYHYHDKKTNKLWTQNGPLDKCPGHVELISQFVYEHKLAGTLKAAMDGTLDESKKKEVEDKLKVVEEDLIEIEVDEIIIDVEDIEIVIEPVEEVIDLNENFENIQKVNQDKLSEDTKKRKEKVLDKVKEKFDAFEFDQQYINKLVGFFQSKKEGIFIVSDLTDDNEKFINHIKYIIDENLVNISFNSDYSKIKVFNLEDKMF